MQKKRKFNKLNLLVLALTATTSAAIAHPFPSVTASRPIDHGTVTFVNQTGEPITFMKTQDVIKSGTLENTLSKFTLSNNGSMKSKIRGHRGMQLEDPAPTAFYHVEYVGNPNCFGYFGVGEYHGTAKVSGFMSRGIAYTWKNQHDLVVTFKQPIDRYTKCLVTKPSL